MKRMILILASLLLMISPAALGETTEEDYSWLDDLSINQLKRLDKEIHKRLPEEETEAQEKTEGNGFLNQIFGGGGSSGKKAVEAKAIEVNQTIVTETAEFTILSTAFLGTKKAEPSEWRTITGSGAKEKFYFDADCGAFIMVYKVKNISNSAKWFWPSNLMVKLHWNEYEFEKLGAKPLGDLQITQTDTYIAVVQIPNEILKQGCKDIEIEIGFREGFQTLSSLEYADHRFVMHQGY